MVIYLNSLAQAVYLACVNAKMNENQRSVMENKYIAVIELFFLASEVVVHH